MFASLQPDLECDGWLRSKSRELRTQFALVQNPHSEAPPRMSLGPDALASLHLAVATYRLAPAALQQFIERFRLLKEDRELLLEVAALRQRVARLAENELRASDIVAALDETSDAARLVLRVATDSWLVRQRLDQYQRRLRYVRPAMQGNDLRRMGLQPGPIYRVFWRVSAVRSP